MSSERMITDDAVAEGSSQCNIDGFSDDHAHPRVTAKKTFFDLHRHRRRNDADAADADTYRPRIQWSAGTTSIGNGYQRVAYDESLTRDMMKPVLQREPSKPDPASIFQVPIPKSNLPPVPDIWGPMDAQPTQPEEVQHLLEFSPVIQRPSVPEEAVKPRRKFGDVFRKGSTAAAVLDTKSSEASRVSEEQVDSVRPEEEFRLLNERYIRDGVIPAESTTIEVAAGSTGSQTRFDSKKGRKDHPKASGTSLDRERSIGHRAGSERDRRIPRRELFHEKRVTIDSDAIGYASPEGSSSSPLPARRSCEPLDVKNLRKLRESETEPSTSRVGERDGESGSTSDFVDENFATRATKIFVYDAQSDEVVPSSDSEDSSKGPTKEEACKVDSFKIDNPFSDFSLQKVNRDKGLLRQRTVETAIKTPPSYRDPAQPGTSNGAHAMEIYRRKVSRSESVEQPKKKSREHSFLRSAVSRVKRASSFLDKAVTAKSSQRIPDSMTKRWIPKSCSKEEKKRSGIDREFGKDFLEATVRRLGGNSVGLACMGLRDDQDDFCREIMVFHCYDCDLPFFFGPLTEVAIEPIFYNFLKNYPSTSSSGFSGRSFDTVPAMVNDVKWAAETVGFFETAWPKTIDDLVNVSRIVQKNMASVYSADDETPAEFPPLPDDAARLECVRSDELVDKITQEVVNIVTSQNLISEIMFLSFSPMPDSTKNKCIFEGSYFSGTENHWPFAFGFFDAPIVIFLDDFLNLDEHRDYQKCELLERFFFNLIWSTMRNLRFAYI